MRLNKFIASSTGLSRRAADAAVKQGRVLVNGQKPAAGYDVASSDVVTLDKRAITPAVKPLMVMLNKPAGYVVSRAGQGSRTVYDLLPPELHHLKPVGRLDKNSAGLLLLTNDGELAHELTHPSRQKLKLYEVTLDKPLQPLHRQMIQDHGITLDDGLSKFEVERIGNDDHDWRVGMREGRNRQIRRTFAALGYEVTGLNRTQFGQYRLGGLRRGRWEQLPAAGRP
jgi:23S rRNA pseudouridine2605 synthase